MTTKFCPPFLLIRNNGEVRLCNDLKDIYHLRDKVGAAHLTWVTSWGNEFFAPSTRYDANYKSVGYEWIVRDDHGQIVRPRDIYDARPESFRTGPWSRSGAKLHAEALGLPIPDTGKSRKPRKYRGFRHPKHMCAYRANYAIEAEDDEDYRMVKGKIKMPRNAWDDISRACLDNRNWKRYRKTQWK